MPKPIIRPIEREDADRVAALLHARFMTTTPVDRIRRLVLHDWPVDRPNYGFLLESEGKVVGCLLAAYSERIIRGRVERFCNRGPWYVEPEFRAYSLLLPHAFGQLRGPYTHTAFTPNPTSELTFRRSKYRPLDTEFRVYFPWNREPRSRLFGGRVLTDLAALERELDPIDRRLLSDHRPFGLSHYLLQAPGESEYTYVIAQRRRFGGRQIGWVSELLYVSNKAMAVRYFDRLKRAILWHDRAIAVVSDPRLLGGANAPAGLSRKRPRFFLSETLEADDIDNLYSEVVLL